MKGLAMSRERKIHCKIGGHFVEEVVVCGRSDWIVQSVNSYLFDKFKLKHKCLQCAKKENSGN